MNTPESTSRPQRGRAYWHEHINAWRAAGGTQSDYCREHDLSERLFSLWKNKFLKEQERAKPSDIDFLPVMTRPRATPKATAEPIGIRLPNGLHLQVPAALPGASVAELVRHLVSLSC